MGSELRPFDIRNPMPTIVLLALYLGGCQS